MGSDLDPINAAKASFSKKSETFGDPEGRLLAFLQREEHTSVFRHSALTFEVRAPLLVARQWFKYIVGSSHTEDQQGWNENSRRYITDETRFYLPAADQWRSAPDNMKQGSGDPIPSVFGAMLTAELSKAYDRGEEMYERAMKMGVAPEQARLFIPAYGLYVNWYWTCSLGALMHFLQQRLAHDAQVEIQEYAKAVHTLGSLAFPVCMDSIVD